MLSDPDCPWQVLKDALDDEGIVVAKIYVLWGCCGEYSDYRNWEVRAYLDPDMAQIDCARLNDWCIEHKIYGHSDEGRLGNCRWDFTIPCPYDPHFFTNTTGTVYNIAQIDLVG